MKYYEMFCLMFRALYYKEHWLSCVIPFLKAKTKLLRNMFSFFVLTFAASQDIFFLISLGVGGKEKLLLHWNRK